MNYKQITVTDEQIIEAINNNLSMRAAALSLSMSMTSFKRRAIKLRVYKTNQGLRGSSHKDGTKKGGVPPKYNINDVLNGKHPDYNRKEVKKHLLKLGIKQNKCEICGFEGMWNGKLIICILDHINGINNDHRLENLRMVCPMCNSQLDTFCSKNITNKKKTAL